MFTNQFVFQLNLGKMYSWNFDINPFKEESLQCSIRGNKHHMYASTRNKLFILGQQDGLGKLGEKIHEIQYFTKSSLGCTVDLESNIEIQKSPM